MGTSNGVANSQASHKILTILKVAYARVPFVHNQRARRGDE